MSSEKKRIERTWFWLDLEMSGLDFNKDKILEIAILVTDESLNIIAEGPEIVINQSEKVLNKMDEWNTLHHNKSGLIDKVRESEYSELDAEFEVLSFVEKFADQNECVLCGNSIYIDKLFLNKFMPRLHNFFHFRVIDVSSIMEIAKRWYPDIRQYKYNANHRAMDDAKESVEALKYYRDRIFKPDLLS